MILLNPDTGRLLGGKKVKKGICIGVIILMLAGMLIPAGRTAASMAVVPLTITLPGDGEKPEDGTTLPEDGITLPDGGEAPEETTVPEIELPGETQPPDNEETPDETQAPEDGNTPGETLTPKDGKTPDETQTPDDGETPGETLAPEDPENPDGENMPGGETLPEVGTVSEGAVSGDSLTASAEESGTSIPLWLILTVSGVVVVLIIVIIILARKNKKMREKTVSPAGAQSMPQESQNMQAGGNSGIAMKFEVLYGDCKHKEMRLSLEDTLTIGSDAGCDIIFQNPDVSPVNSRIVFRNGMIYIEDMNSALGTAIGGMRIQGSNRLRSGDLISIGEVEFTVKF